MERAVRLVRGSAGALYLVQAEGTIECVVSHRFTRDFSGLRLRPDEGVAGRVAATGALLITGDYPHWPGRAAAYAAESFRSVIAAPIRAQGQVVGVLVVTDDAPDRFSPIEAEIVSLFADQAAVAIVNARLYAEVRANALELGRLFAAAQEMTASHEPRQGLTALARHLTEGLSATSVYFSEVNLARPTLIDLANFSSAAPSTSQSAVDEN